MFSARAGFEMFSRTAVAAINMFMFAQRVVWLAVLLTVLCLMVSAQSLNLSFQEYPSPDSIITFAPGPDGAMWFTEWYAHKIARITATGSLTEYAVQSALPGVGGVFPTAITAGPDGALWFSDGFAVGRITTSGQVTSFPLPVSITVGTITSGPDGALWFTSGISSAIGRLTTTGSLTTYNTPSPCNGTPFGGIVAGPDGAIWFTDKCSSSVGRITTAGIITEYPVSGLPSGGIGNITVGPDGALWFTEGIQSFGRINTSGVLTQYPLGLGSGTLPTGITTGPDKAIWFTTNTNLIGRITTAGVTTTYSTPTYAAGITLGPDGALWLLESNGFCGSGCYYKILRVEVPARTGVLSHIAAGGSWSTVVTLVNTGSVAVPVTLALHNDDGSALSLPVTTTQQGSSQTATTSSVNATMNPNTTLLVSMGDQVASTVVGWADVTSTGPLGGFAIFRQTPQSGSPSEGTVPLQSQFPSTFALPYDNTAGFIMGVAIANLSASSATITATIWDDSGNLLGTQTINIAGSGHTAFVLPNQIALTAGKRGVVQFKSSSTDGIAGLGLRFSPFGTFTSVPTILQ